MNLIARLCMASSCAVALLPGEARAQRPNVPTAPQGVVTHGATRVLDLEWLRNHDAVFGGATVGGQIGQQVAAAGDANGDGLADLLVAGAADGEPGTVYLVFGAAHALPDEASLTAPGTGPFQTRGFGGPWSAKGTAKAPQAFVRLLGIEAGSQTGAALGSADLNGDGLSDLIIGAPFATGDGGPESGKVHVILGMQQWPASIDLASLSLPAAFTIEGPQAGDRLGSAVAGVGDVDGDGLEDMLLAADFSSAFPEGGIPAGDFVLKPSHSGTVALVYGQHRFPVAPQLDRMLPSTGMVFTGAAPGDRAGQAIAAAGDVDGDGLADFAIGAPLASPAGLWQAGEAYLVFGSTDLPAFVDLDQLGSRGLTVQGSQAGEHLGAALGGGSDVDQDGFDDLAIGAPGFDAQSSGSDQGRVLILLGNAHPGHQTITAGAPVNPTTAGGSSGYAGVGGGDRGFPGMTATGTAKAGMEQHVLIGAKPGEQVGATLATGGDLHGDGFADVVAGSGSQPHAYVFVGGLELEDERSLGSLSQDGVVFATDGDGALPLAFVGDMDGDGFDELALGRPGCSPNGAQGAGQVHVVKGCANYAVAVGHAVAGNEVALTLHGTPGVAFTLLVAPAALAAPLSTSRGDWWLGPQSFVTSVSAFNAHGVQVIPLVVPDAGLEGMTVYWQAMSEPQGQGQDLTGLLAMPIEP